VDLLTFIKSERGNASRLAASIGVSLSHLSQMSTGTTAISPKRCVQIEEATGGGVTRQDLRPDDWVDIWPELRPVIEQAA
jgi:DNA-binding transcriptional regulator YdaS (Cro superfamily)